MDGRLRMVALILLSGISVACALSQDNLIRLSGKEPLEEVVRRAAMVAPTPQQLSWQQMEFNVFCHFGMNTMTNKEWGDGKDSPSLFNPSNFDARQWARIIRDAGSKMIILTAKHHDGFCLWPSAYTQYSVKFSPWKDGNGDVVSEVASACREYGLKFGIYLSPWDRHDSSYGDSPRYNEHFRNQLTELLSNYGKISEVWFDGACGEGPNGKKQIYDWASYYAVVRRLQPNAVIAVMGPDVRWVGTESGVGRETEWSVLPGLVRDSTVQRDSVGLGSFDKGFVPQDRMGDDLGSRERLKGATSLAWYPAETDVSIRPGWFYHAREDTGVKSAEELVNLYFTSVGRNSVLLLNVPPDRTGRIAPPDSAALIGMSHALDNIFDHHLVRSSFVVASTELIPGSARSLSGTPNVEGWSPASDDTARTIIIDLSTQSGLKPNQAFNILALRENIRNGQRVESFVFEVWTSAGWREIVKGTTIGYRRLIRFPRVETERVRLRITGSRSIPNLTSIGLYLSDPN